LLFLCIALALFHWFLTSTNGDFPAE